MTALRIGDEPLTPAALVAAARTGKLEVELTAAARRRMAEARRIAATTAERRPIYGLTTGVGANRRVFVEEADLRAHSVRLLRSHAGGVGDSLPDEVVRGTILVRLAQMAAGGGGQRPAVAEALAAVLRERRLPVLRDLGGIGTGDLTLLSQLALALAGEGEWSGERAAAARITIEAGDGLAFISSNAATFAAAALAWADVRELLDAGLGVAALTFRALDGNGEAFAAPVAAARPLPGLGAVSERLRVLTAGAGEPARLQDPFGLRCLPPVAGALHDAAAALEAVLAVDVNAAAENPLIVAAGTPPHAAATPPHAAGTAPHAAGTPPRPGQVLHHGGFHAAPCALALDTLRLALVPFASLSAARLAHLMEPRLSRLPAFLTLDAAGSSGVLICEYLAADALARLRADAVPAVLGTAAISRGLEEHASFAWQAAGQTRHAVLHLRTVLALEWVVAERALRMKDVPDPDVLAPMRALAAGFDPALEDRPIGPDTALAEAALPALARAVRNAAS